jgi:predicted transcriptional regulator
MYLIYEGVRVTQQAVDILRILVDNPTTAGVIAQARQVAHSTCCHTMNRLQAVGLVESWLERATRGGKNPRMYKLTDKAKRLLHALDDGAVKMKEATSKAQETIICDADEDKWPRADYAAIVATAMQTQPTSVFDLGRARCVM